MPSLQPWQRDVLAAHRGGLVLTLGILSLICFGIILGPIACLLASADLRAMAEGRMDPSGEAMTRRGQVCGIIGTIAAAFIILVLMGMR